MDEIIKKAIAEKKVLEFFYDGQRRIVEPHCYGLTTAGNWCLRGFQVAGGSVSGFVPHWKLFDLAEIRGLRMLEDVFLRPRPEYKRNDRAMVRIQAQL